MKKMVSMLLSAAIGLTAITPAAFGRQEKKAEAAEKGGLVLFGDSIASGDTRNGKVAHNYGEICGDYLGCKVSNYAVSGHTTADLIKDIDGLSAEQKKNVADAEVIVISVGGNDIMKFASKKLIQYAANKGFLNDGYTKENVPSDPTITDMMNIVKLKGDGSLAEFASKGLSQALEVNSQIGGIATDLCSTADEHDGYIDNVMMPNIKTAVTKLKAISPDSRIMIQNIYQPVELDPSYVETNYGKGSGKATVINTVRSRLEFIMTYYDTKLNMEGYDVVDVKSLFTSNNGILSASNPGNANYFVDIQTGSLSTGDVHPNQKGHLAIATAVLEKINKLHNDNGLLRKTYNGLSDKNKYPAIALNTFKKVAGEDPTLTTTSTTVTTTTTKKTTTTTTTSTTTTTKKPTTTTTVKVTTTTKKTTVTTTTKSKPVTTTTQPVKTISLGDVDNNKAINAVDASYVLEDYARTSTNQSSKFSEDQKNAADVDKNGKINAVDASYILSYYAYISTTKEAVMSIEEYTNSSKWEKAYQDKLTEFMNSDAFGTIAPNDSMFDLRDINGDNIPELFISVGTYHAATVQAYSFLNGEIIELFDGGEYGLLKYIPSESYLYENVSYAPGPGRSIDHLRKVYQYDGKTITKVIEFGDNARGMNNYFTINGTEVDKNEYYNKIEKYNLQSSILLGRNYLFDSVNINNIKTINN